MRKKKAFSMKILLEIFYLKKESVITTEESLGII